METALQKVFDYQGAHIRTKTADGETWFVARDVCGVLEISNTADALSRIDDDEKGFGSIDTPGGRQAVAVVNEYGLYSLVLGSRKPEAKQFKRWVTHEVLPQIRQTGMYVPQTLPEALRLAADLAEKNQNLLLLSAQKEQIINELKPKATYYDLILQNKSLLSVTQIAKDYGMSATALNKVLAEEKVQFKQGDCWLLYQKYANKGYTQSKTHVVDETKSTMHTYWTQTGRIFIYDLLKNQRNILPVIEREKEAS